MSMSMSSRWPGMMKIHFNEMMNNKHTIHTCIHTLLIDYICTNTTIHTYIPTSSFKAIQSIIHSPSSHSLWLLPFFIHQSINNNDDDQWMNNWIVLVNYSIYIHLSYLLAKLSRPSAAIIDQMRLQQCLIASFKDLCSNLDIRIRNSLLQQFKYHNPISGSPTLSRSWVEPKYGKVVLSLYKNSTVIATKILRILWRKLHTLKSHQFILKKCLFEGINRGSKLVWKISVLVNRLAAAVFFYLRWVSMVNYCTSFILVFL